MCDVGQCLSRVTLRKARSEYHFLIVILQEKCDPDDLCFYLVSSIMFYMMFKKVLNWQDAGRYMAIKVHTFHFRLAVISVISNICTGHVEGFSRQRWTTRF